MFSNKPLGTLGSLLSFCTLASVLSACHSSAPISQVTLSRDPRLSGEIQVAGTTYPLKEGEATSTYTFNPVNVDHITVKLNYTESRNQSSDADTDIAVIESRIGVGEDSHQQIFAGTAGGSVSVAPNPGDLPVLVANCDNLFQVSVQGTRLTIGLNGFSTLPSCAPAPKANLDIYNPSKIGKRDVSEGLAIYTLEEDQQRGEEFLAEYIKENTLLIHDRNDIYTKYVQSIAEKVVAASDRPDQKVTAFVLDMDEINAFAIPGGFVFVNTGLIKAADSEAELVGVLGHEWSHVTCRHASRYRSAFRILIGASNADQRDIEYEADAVGSQYAWNAGYEPWGLNKLFELIEKEDPDDGKPSVEKKSDHPSSYKRIDRVNMYSQLFYPGKDHYLHSSNAFAVISALLRAKAKTFSTVVDPANYKKRVIDMFERHFIYR